MRPFLLSFVFAAVLGSAGSLPAGSVEDLALRIDPVRLDRLGEGEFVSAIFVTLADLHTNRAKLAPDATVRAAYRSLGEPDDLTNERVTAWMRMLRGAGESGVFNDAEQFRAMARGLTPTGSIGAYKNKLLSLAAVAPVRQFPALALEVANRELVPQGMKPPQSRRQSIETVFAVPSGQPAAPAVSSIPSTLNSPAARDEPQYVEVQMEFGRSYNLSFWGGPDREFVLMADNGGSISYAVLDYANTRTVWRTDAYGYYYPVDIPAEYRRSASKTNGVSIAGKLTKLYPIYSVGGLVIYFNDTIATEQNHRRVVIKTVPQ